jgi:hypothetical protein
MYGAYNRLHNMVSVFRRQLSEQVKCEIIQNLKIIGNGHAVGVKRDMAY